MFDLPIACVDTVNLTVAVVNTSARRLNNGMEPTKAPWAHPPAGSSQATLSTGPMSPPVVDPVSAAATLVGIYRTVKS